MNSKLAFKYYAFDLDGNLFYMPTKIIVFRKGTREKVELSPAEWREVRLNLDKYGYEIYNDTETFLNFRKYKDDEFIEDIKTAEFGPSWKDFVECINNASIFAIITARGHTRGAFKKAIKWLLENNINGISVEQFVEHQKMFMDKAFESYNNFSNNDFIDYYLNLCRFYGMNDEESLMELFGKPDMLNIDQEFKIVAISKFEEYIVSMGNFLQEKFSTPNSIIKLGFSDDDFKNYETILNHFDRKNDKIVERKVYYTGNGLKE